MPVPSARNGNYIAKPRASPKVIGLGFPRTATGTLCSALEILGLGPCHHLSVLLRAPPEMSHQVWHPWETANKDNNMTRRAELVLEALMGYSSAADVPVVSFWKELLHAQAIGLLPNTTRFILPTRRAEEWYSSAEQTILAGWTKTHNTSASHGGISSHVQRMGRLAWAPLFGRERLQLPQERETLIAAYMSHQKDVQQNAAPGSLLLWDPQDGWSGLCEPLGLPTPGAAFPWRNQRGSHVSELLGYSISHFSARMVAMSFNFLMPLLVIIWCIGQKCGAPSEISQEGEKED